MPEKKSRLALTIANEQKARGITDREAATEIGVLQQTYSTRKGGRVPREKMHAGLARFLGITISQLDGLLDEAVDDANRGKLPPLAVYAAARVYGRMADRKEGKLKFDTSRKTIPEGRYAVIVDTKIMEPVLHVGSKVWLDPGVWPKVGDDVIVHAHGIGWIGRLVELGPIVRLERYAGQPVEVKDVDAVHVIVLAERV